ncbi:MAG: hypothetical protein ACP5H5_03015 [Pyrobaculum sp.]|jgi:predicted ATPase
MVDYVEVETRGRKAAVRLAGATFITGTGKSTFIEILYRVLSSVGKKLPRVGGGWSFYAQSGDVAYLITAGKGRVRQSVAVGGEELVFEYIPSRGAHRIVKPINMSVANADVVIPLVRAEEHVSMVADEDIERFNSMLAAARKALGVKIQFLGPYIAPRSVVDADVKNVDLLERHGRNLVAVLSNLALYRPTAYDSIRAVLRKVGFTVSVGLAKPGKIGAFVATGALKMPLGKAPCSVKSLLALAVALELKPDILVVDNLDYCLTPSVAEVLTSMLRQKQTKLVAEVHHRDVVDWIGVPDKAIVEIRL